MWGVVESLSLTTWLLVGAGTLLVLWIWKSCRVYNTFKNMGIPGPKPYPFVGNTGTMMKKGFVKQVEEDVAQYGKVYGIFFTFKPMFVISDLDIIKEILVKKFQSFPNRLTRKLDYRPWKDMLLQLEDDHWKHVRNTLSPTFSSARMKRIIPAIQRVVATLTEHLKDKAKTEEMVELKELCGRFSMDVIAAAAFGIDVSSIKNPDEQFVKHAYDIINPSKIQLPLMIWFPSLVKYAAKLGLLSSLKSALDFFIGVTEVTLRDRQQESKSQKHHDFLQLLVESQAEENTQSQVDADIDHSTQLNTSAQWTRKGLTANEMMDNSFLFLLAGYETVSTVLSFTLFCLAINPECLKKAQDEIDEKLGKNTVNYEIAGELVYLDQCINESMRLFPPGLALNRQASEDVEIKGLKIKKGMGVLIPATTIHRDPEIWNDPEKFDPDRHTPEARAQRHPFSFMPFGFGPRNCIGIRMAQLEVRISVAAVLQHFTPVLCEKSVYPIKIQKHRMASEDGLWVKMQPRD